MICECHKINWLARVRNPDKQYRMLDGSLQIRGVDCQDKVNLGKMEYDTYLSVCKYLPEEGSLFPAEVLEDLMSEYSDNPAPVSPEPAQSQERNTPVICQIVMGWYQHTEEEAERSEEAIDVYIEEH